MICISKIIKFSLLSLTLLIISCGGGNIGKPAPSLVITVPSIIPTAVINQEYSLQLGLSNTIANNNYTWSISQCDGLTINNTGLINGIPSSIGTFSCVVTVIGTTESADIVINTKVRI